MRVRQVQMREKLTAAAARRHIEAMDKARSRRLMALFGVDWRDPNRHDFVVNLGRVRMTAAKRLILETGHLPDYEMTPSFKQAFFVFFLAAPVRAGLVLCAALS